ncbi:MAG: MBG domain-containing protein, partial [Eubacterium sp.]
NAGTYPITVQSCSNTNYKVTAVPGTLTVMKRPIALGWNCESTYSYTGKPVNITCEVASVNVQFGDYEGSPCTFRVFCNQKVEVGYYTAFAIITNANYTYNAGNALDNVCYYEIVKADPDVTFPSEISLTYGQTLSQAEFTGADSKGIPGEFKIKEETSDSSLLTPSDSGTKLEVQFVPQDTKNYNVISREIPLEVSKKTIVVRAEDQKQIYGDEIAEFAWSMDESQLVGDDKKEDFAFTLTAKKGGSDVFYLYPDAGLYEISISCDEGNSVAETIQKYTFDFRQGSLEISPRVAEIQWSDTTCIVKDGSGPSATIANLVGPDDCTVTVESDGTDALSYDEGTDTWTPYTARITGLSG